MLQVSQNVREVQDLVRLDTKSTGFHPKTPLFFRWLGEKPAALGRGREVLKNSRGIDEGQEG